MNESVKRVLINAENKRELIGIYSDYEDSSKFAVGYILTCDEIFVLIGHVNPKGSYDGYVMKQIDNIYLIEKGGKYLSTVIKLFKNQEQRANWDINLKGEKLAIPLMMLEYAKTKQLLISIKLIDSGNDDVKGYVIDIEENNIVCQTVNDYGEKGGLAYFSASNITHLVCDSEEYYTISLISSLKN